MEYLARFGILSTFSILMAVSVFYLLPDLSLTIRRNSLNLQGSRSVSPPRLKSTFHTVFETYVTTETYGPRAYENCKVYDSWNGSVVEIVERKECYNVSDRVAVRIEMKKEDGSMKLNGGDYFRIKLFSKNPYSAIGPESFIDYDNGTYLATFTLRWQGIVYVSIQLVHSSCVIHLLKRTSQESVAKSLLFVGRFEKKLNGLNYVENVQCGLEPRQLSYCNVSALHTHGPWFCNKPKNHNLSCKDWARSNFDVPKSQISLRNLLAQAEYSALIRTKVPLSTLPMPSIKVTGSDTTEKELPFCKLKPVPLDIQVNGYYQDYKWKPFDCKIRSFGSEQITSCLSGKFFHFLGDSTTRQIYDYLQANMNCTNTGNQWVKFCKCNNGSIHFKFHGPPVRVSRGATVREIRYLADEIDAIRGGPEVYLVISVWAHFGMPDLEFYRSRLKAIRWAVGRLLDRSPQTKVIIRSTNTREHTIGSFLLVSSDWVALQLEKVLRDVFNKDKRVSFYDVLDMTLVQASRDSVHPMSPALEQLMDYLLTMVCYGDH